MKYKLKHPYLAVGTLVVDLGQQPVYPAISREEDGVVFSRFLLQLDGDRHQLVIPVHVEEAEWSARVVAVSQREPIHHFHVTEVHTPSLVVVVWVRWVQACTVTRYFRLHVPELRFP